MASLPVWKAQLLERKRKDEEEGRRKEKEEMERVANIPGWMKEVMERRRTRLGSRPWHSEGSQAGGGRGEERRADNLGCPEPEGAVVRDKIGPVKRNPFVRQEKERREGQWSRPGLGENMGVRTIRAEGITIQEGLEIRRPPSRRPTLEAALTRSVEDLSSWGMGEESEREREGEGEGEGEGEVRRGRVRILLSRFGQRRGSVARSHSTENVPRRPPSHPKVPGSTPQPPSPPRAGNEGGTLLLLGNNGAPAHACPPLPRDSETPRHLSPPWVGKKPGAIPVLEDPRVPPRANPALPRDPETPLPPSSQGKMHPALEDTRVPVRANPPLPRDPKTPPPLSPPWVGCENGLLPSSLGDPRAPVPANPPLPRNPETPLHPSSPWVGNEDETHPALGDTRLPAFANPETARPLSPPQVGNQGGTLSSLGDARVPALLPRDQEAPWTLSPPWVDNQGGTLPKVGDPRAPARAHAPLPRDQETPRLLSPSQMGNEGRTLSPLGVARVPDLLPRDQEAPRPLSPPQDPTTWSEEGRRDPRRSPPPALAGEGEQGARAEGPECGHGSPFLPPEAGTELSLPEGGEGRIGGVGSLGRPQAAGAASASPPPSPSLCEPPPPCCRTLPNAARCFAAPDVAGEAGHEPRDRERVVGEELDPSASRPAGVAPSMNRLHGAALPRGHPEPTAPAGHGPRAGVGGGGGIPQRKAGRTITINPRKAVNRAENGLPAPQLTQPPPTATTTTPGKKRYPTAEQILVIGGYLDLRRSCLVKSGSSRRKLNISFNDGELESTFEYPSELALLAEFGEEEEEVVSTPQFRQPEEEEEEEEEEAPVPRLEVPGSPLVGRAVRRKPLLVDENCR